MATGGADAETGPADRGDDDRGAGEGGAGGAGGDAGGGGEEGGGSGGGGDGLGPWGPIDHVVVFGATDQAVRAIEHFAERCDTVDVVWERFPHALQVLGEGQVVRLLRAKVQEHSFVQFLEDDPMVVVATGDETLDALITSRAMQRGLAVVGFPGGGAVPGPAAAPGSEEE